jgi:hypothetical protein
MNTSIIATAALGALLVSSAGISQAQTYRHDAPREIQVIVNGDRIEFKTIGPREINGRLLVPLRGVLEKLGAFVEWDVATHTVLVNRQGTRIEIPIGSRYATVNGERLHVDVAPITISGITMVPLRFLSETLGARVNWDEQINTARIASGDGSATTGSNEDSTPASNAYRRQRTEDPSKGVRDAKMPIVESVDTEFRGGKLIAGETVHITMRATAGGKGFFRIRGVVGEQKMQETSTGVYEGSWRAPSSRDFRVNRVDILAFVVIGERATAEKTP